MSTKIRKNQVFFPASKKRETRLKQKAVKQILSSQSNFNFNQLFYYTIMYSLNVQFVQLLMMTSSVTSLLLKDQKTAIFSQWV